MAEVKNKQQAYTVLKKATIRKEQSLVSGRQGRCRLQHGHLVRARMRAGGRTVAVAHTSLHRPPPTPRHAPRAPRAPWQTSDVVGALEGGQSVVATKTVVAKNGRR